ncbi:MAG: preprotein translocase subunit YajC [Oscillospiraceae bacterium]|nr:preprotein translocase subunit YajC [Oscillospiraceae bacterium]
MFYPILEATAEAGGANMTSFIITIVAMIGIFYFMLIRPENKRKKEAEELRSSVKVGDRVTTIGGITGTVVSVKDDKFVLETGADQVRIEFLKWALSSNDSAAEAAKEAQKKADEAKAKAKAEKKAKKAQKNIDDKA